VHQKKRIELKIFFMMIETKENKEKEKKLQK
jgi:hypothetical protein